jgi:hypothetical protein
MKTRLTTTLAVACAAIGIAAVPALAGTKYQTSLVPIAAGSMPGFSSSGSSIKLDDKLSLKGKIKNVVDGAGMRVTTDGVPSSDDYSVEVDLGLASGTSAGTVAVLFDLKNGNGKFSADLTGNPAIAGGVSGDGVAVTGVRVKNGSGAVIGVGGFAIK